MELKLNGEILMGTVNGTLLQNLFNDSDITATKAEIVINQAINTLNNYLKKYDMQISNLAGAAGSKSGTYTSEEEGAIMELARSIYMSSYKSSGAGSSSYQIGSLGYSTSTTTVTQEIRSQAMELAKNLVEPEISTN